MCGIVGYINPYSKPCSKNVLKEMTNLLVIVGLMRRILIKNNVAIGHRRLSVIDLSTAGKQPMVSRDGRFVLTYNGEIYNYKELRYLLIQKGYVFLSKLIVRLFYTH